MKKVTGVLFGALLAGLGVFALQTDVQGIRSAASNLTASVFFTTSTTERSLKETYAEVKRDIDKADGRKVRVLIVPGHDTESPGTAFGRLREVDLNIELGEELYRLLRTEPLFDVYLSQTKAGYNPIFRSYFETNRESIFRFIDKHKGFMDYLVNTEKVQRVINVEHNDALSEVALKLFGINKWANEQSMDIVIHVHFNDYANRRRASQGIYSGYAIYVPESQYSNAEGSKSIAEAIHHRLAALYAQSDLPKEDVGVVEDQELIAIGSNNTLDSAGMLIEYAYIYESSLNNPAVRSVLLKDFALQTFLGVMDFFGEDTAEGGAQGTRLLPYQWKSNMGEEEGSRRDVVSLQAALQREGLYPPSGKSKNECGLTGYFGVCTETALKAFQKKYGIVPAEGYVGERTRARLNALYQK